MLFLLRNGEIFCEPKESYLVDREDGIFYDKVFVATEIVNQIDVDRILEAFAEDMHDDWIDCMDNSITEEERKLIDSIFKRACEANPTYYEGEEVEIDC